MLRENLLKEFVLKNQYTLGKKFLQAGDSFGYYELEQKLLQIKAGHYITNWGQTYYKLELVP